MRYPFVTLIVIVITANHYILDAVGGLVILGLGWFMSGRVTRSRSWPVRSTADAPRSPRFVTDRYDLDHVALAAADTSDALRFLTGALGGTVIFGGQAIGFRPMQVWLGDARRRRHAGRAARTVGRSTRTTSSPASLRATARARIT